MLHDPSIGGNQDADHLLKLCKQAGYTEEEAQRLATERANERLDRDLSP